jgi:hypothetical protein
MTRRDTGQAVGLAAAGLAAFFVVTAAFPGLSVIGHAAHPVLTHPETIVLTASDATYLSPVTLAEVSGARIEETRTVTPDVSSGNSSVAVWTVTTSRLDTTHHQQLEPASRRFAIDRDTAQLVSCCGASIDGNMLIRQSGLSGYAFPAGTRKQAYYVFDTVLGRPEPAVYTGSGTIDGIPAYQYTETVTAARAGFSPFSATDPQFYSARNSYWVDPETGALLAVTMTEDLYLAGPVVRTAVTSPAPTRLFDANLTTTPASVAELAARDLAVRHEIAVARDLRLACLALAIVLAGVAWFALSVKQSPSAPHYPYPRIRRGGNSRKQITAPAPEFGIEMPPDGI